MEKDPVVTGETGSLTGSTVRGAFWLTATRIVKAPINLIAVAILARLLTPADFGIVAVAFLVKSLSDVIIDGSFGMVLIQRRSIKPALIGASLACSVALAAVFAAAVIISAPVVERAFDFPELGKVLILLGVFLPLTAVTTITTALLQRALKFSALTLIGLVSQLAYSATAIALAFAGLGLWSLVWAQVVQFVVEALLGLLPARRQYRFRFSREALGEVLQSGGMFTISKLLHWGASNADRVIIGRLLGAADVGFYSRATSLMTTARQLSGTGTLRVLFPTFAKIQHDQARMRNGYLRALSITLNMATLVSAFMVLNSDFIVRVMLGPQWLPTVPLVMILFSGFVARSGYMVAEAVPLALGLSGQSALRQGAQLVLVVVGAAVGAQFGIVGAAIGVAIAFWLFYFLCLVLVRRLLHVSWFDTVRLHVNSLLVALAPTLAALAARSLLPDGNLLLQTVPALVFMFVAAAVVLVAPARLIGEDLVGARSKTWAQVSRRLPFGLSR